MALKQEVDGAVKKVVGADWSIRKGQVVPTTEQVALANGGVELDAVYLYADLANSTALARNFTRSTAAKVIRAYLDGSCRVIKARGGEIRGFDGDRVLAIFVGSNKNTAAAKCALQINHVVKNIIRPAVDASLPSLAKKGFVVRHCVGVASGTALLVRGGVRGSNDLVSTGRAPNVAAKLSDVRNAPYFSYITKKVFDDMHASSKFSEGKSMWEGVTREVGGEKMTVYKSSWSWSL